MYIYIYIYIYQFLEESDGAKCVFTSVSEAPLIIQKADGGYGYDSTDCAAVLQRLNVRVLLSFQQSRFRRSQNKTCCTSLETSSYLLRFR